MVNCLCRFHWLLVACVLAGLAGPSHAQFTLDREPPGPSTRRTGLVITEIMYHPRPEAGLTTNLTREFIELYNSKPWAENLSGFAIDGDVHFVFPSNTLLQAGAYLVVARVPDIVMTNHGITNVYGPWDGAGTNRLSMERGIVRLRNRQGAILLDVNYADSPPWPETADGPGHSLVLVRPSYGENDFRAWAESDSVGGSPGRPDPVTHDPMATVCINEWQNHSDPVDYIELYNHANTDVDLSGAWLSDDPTTNKFRISDFTVIPARGFVVFDQNDMGFELFAGGESMFLWNADQTRVIDAIDFRGSSNNVSSGRWPDGGPIQYGMSRRTPEEPNAPPVRSPIVITEIMYNPISGDTEDEYLEFHNRSSSYVNLSAWSFLVGISYIFPNNTPPMPPGAYWVMAKSPTNLFTIYSNLNSANTFGPYTGTLANGGERILLTSADYDTILVNGTRVEAKLDVPISELIYGDGGKWGDWSDGRGSSLELIDVEADEHFPSNWADSDDTGESLWTAIEYTGPVGETLGTAINDRLIILLQGIGECLVDEVEVRVDNGPNLVVNGGFEAGLEGWRLQGSHDFSTLEGSGFAGGKSLHVRAGSRGDNQSNRILSAPLAHPVPADAKNVSIRAKARWVRGHPELLLRLHGSATEAFSWLTLSKKLGTPGLPNSRRVANAGPAIYGVSHAPILPADGEGVVVSARATDPQGIQVINLRYRMDPNPIFTTLSMTDDGTGGDAIANDGIYSATIPGQPSNTVTAFYVEAKDNQGATGTFPKDLFPAPGFSRCWPSDAVARECVVRWGEVQMPGDFATYHLWITSANSNHWHTRDAQNNTAVDGTFVYNNCRVMYNALPLYSGSPWHRGNTLTGPSGANRVDYEMNFPGDDPLLGSTDFVLNNPGNPNFTTISDPSALAEQTVYKVFDSLGMEFNNRRYIHFFVNGSQRSTAHERPGNFIFEDSQQPNGDMIAQWFPNDAGGLLFKVEDWFEFDDNGYDIAANHDADLTRRTVNINGLPQLSAAPYRFMFRKRSVNIGSSANDYSQILALVDAVSPADNPTNHMVDPAAFGAIADWEHWMRLFAVQRIVGNYDSYGWMRGKNDYLYKPANGLFQHMTWDIDYSMGLGRPANEPLFETVEPRVAAMFNTPAMARAYWRAFADLVSGPFSNENLDPFIDAHLTALTNNNINVDLDAVAAIKTFIGTRRAFIQQQLASVQVGFALDGTAENDTTNNLLVLGGTAPVEVKTVILNGTAYPVTWSTATNFTMTLTLKPGTNHFVVQGFDRFGVILSNAVASQAVNFTGTVPDPTDAFLISEVMYNPALPGAQFIEIMNRTPFNFDLTGWRLDELNFSFPPGSIVTNGQTLVLAQNRLAFTAAYGRIPIFATFSNSLSTIGQTLQLVRTDVAGGQVIDAVRYEYNAPWPLPQPGQSLQLIDPSQDNSRSRNWAVDAAMPATPGAANSVTATLPPGEPLWLNEVQVDNQMGLRDSANEHDPWLELLNGGDTALSLEGYYLADNYTTNLLQWAFPPGMAIGPGEHLVVWADGQEAQSQSRDLHTNFRLFPNGKLALVKLAGDTPQIIDYLTWTNLGLDVSFGVCPEGRGFLPFVLHTPTPGTTNVEPPIRVFINEWLTKNTTGLRDPADNQPADWIELLNANSRAVDLSGFYLSDNAANPTKFMIPTNGQYRIPANGFLLVWADNQPVQNIPGRADLHVDFQLSQTLGDITLYEPDGRTPVDVISYGQQTNDVSQGRYSDGAGVIYYMTKPTPRNPNSAIPAYNTAPRFPDIGTQYAVPGQTVTVNVRGTDPDQYPQVLTYAMESGPAGSVFNPSGLFRWYVPASQSFGDYPVTVRMADNGVPPRSATNTFIMAIRAPREIPTVGLTIQNVLAVGGEATFSFATLPGHTYRVFYFDESVGKRWVQLYRDVVAAGTTISLTDPTTQAYRFYRLQQVD
jgi:hypothetical protein